MDFQKKLVEAIAANCFEWRKHALQRLAMRGIPQTVVLKVLSLGEIIEHYPDDTPYPSALFLGRIEGKPLHVVAALDRQNNWAYIITAYEPDLNHVELGHKERRKKP